MIKEYSLTTQALNFLHTLGIDFSVNERNKDYLKIITFNNNTIEFYNDSIKFNSQTVGSIYDLEDLLRENGDLDEDD